MIKFQSLICHAFYTFCSFAYPHAFCLHLLVSFLYPGTFGGGTLPKKHLSMSTSVLYNKCSSDFNSSTGNLSLKDQPGSLLGKALSCPSDVFHVYNYQNQFFQILNI